MSTMMYDPNLYHLIPMEMIVPKSVRSETVEVLSVNWEYRRDGRSHYIPNLYVLEDQLIVDIFTILDGSAVKAVFEKYQDFEFGRHPVYEVHVAEAELRRELGETCDPEIFLDGVAIMEKMQTGGAFKPWTDDDSTLTPLFHRMKSQFPFLAKVEICFDWRRFGLPWTDGKKRSVGTLTLRYPQTEKWCHIGTPFDITVGEKEHRPVTFVHPVTGITHTLYPEESELLDAREVWRDAYADAWQSSEDSNDLKIRASRAAWQEYEKKPYFATLLYEVVPPLPEGDRLDLLERDITESSCGFILLGNLGAEDAGPHGQKQNGTMTIYHEKPFKVVDFIIAGVYTEGLKEETFEFRV